MVLIATRCSVVVLLLLLIRHHVVNVLVGLAADNQHWDVEAIAVLRDVDIDLREAHVVHHEDEIEHEQSLIVEVLPIRHVQRASAGDVIPYEPRIWKLVAGVGIASDLRCRLYNVDSCCVFVFFRQTA